MCETHLMRVCVYPVFVFFLLMFLIVTFSLFDYVIIQPLQITRMIVRRGIDGSKNCFIFEWFNVHHVL